MYAERDALTSASRENPFHSSSTYDSSSSHFTGSAALLITLT